MAALAPSSPRLPSPPPPAEIQIGPKSPSMGPTASRHAQQMEQSANVANAKRRIHPGTKAVDFAAGPPLVPLNELDSAFQLQEHLAALHYFHTANGTEPINRESAMTLAAPPPGTDRTLWLYELCRFLIAQCNSLIIGFLFDTPPCSAATCPEMRASEWQFLCAVHDAPKSCCAIDYCCHTLDWAANVVTNPKIFPSRFVLADGHDKGAAVKNLVNVFRRLHRIFAHAWFQHRGVFWSVEGQTGLYVLFKTVCDLYDLLPAENYKLPPEAEGLEMAPGAPSMDASGEAKKPQVPGLLPASALVRGLQRGEQPDEDFLQPVGRTNTRRHIRSSPSTGSAVTTVVEQDEDDGTEVTNKLREMHISAPEALDEELEMADVPVIVDHSMGGQENQDPSYHPPSQDDETEALADAVEPAAEEPSASAEESHHIQAGGEPDDGEVGSSKAETLTPPETDAEESLGDSKEEITEPALENTSTHDFATESAEKVVADEPKETKEEEVEEDRDGDKPVSGELEPPTAEGDSST